MDVTTMEAGREMDALVAERVMGWEWRRLNATRWPVHPWGHTRALRRPDCDVWTDTASIADPVHYDDSHIPHYSTDPAAAMLVVEQMERQSEPWLVVMARQAGDDPDNPRRVLWVVQMRQWDAPWGIEWAYADTLPLAICRASRLALNPEAHP